MTDDQDVPDHPWHTDEVSLEPVRDAADEGDAADPEPGATGSSGPEAAQGNDNIREGNVGGLMGGPRQSGGQGQGG